MGRRVTGISRSLIWSETLMEPIFNPWGGFQCSPEDPVSHINSPHSHDGASGISSYLLRSVQMLKREWGAESNGKLPHLFIPSKTNNLGSYVCGGRPPFWTEFQPGFLLSQWKICPWAEHSDDDINKINRLHFDK